MEDKSYLEGLQERVEIYENAFRNLILPWVDKKQHVRDSQEGKEYQGSFHSFPEDEKNVDQTTVTESLSWAFHFTLKGHSGSRLHQWRTKHE